MVDQPREPEDEHHEPDDPGEAPAAAGRLMLLGGGDRARLAVDGRLFKNVWGHAVVHCESTARRLRLPIRPLDRPMRPPIVVSSPQDGGKNQMLAVRWTLVPAL